MFLGANTPECESSRFPGHFAPGSESSREREGQGTKVPGSELARVLLADSLPGANWPGSEKAVNLKYGPARVGPMDGGAFEVSSGQLRNDWLLLLHHECVSALSYLKSLGKNWQLFGAPGGAI